MRRAKGPRRGRAFTLLEALAVILVVAVAVPPLVATLRQQVDHATDNDRRSQALWLATGVLETILADVASTDPSLGFAALADPRYVDAPASGLRARLGAVAGPLEDAGFRYTVSIGDPITLEGAPAGPDEMSALRMISVEVSFARAGGGRAALTVRTLVVNA